MTDPTIKFDNVTIDLQEARVYRAGVECKLSLAEYRTLCLLCASAPAVVSSISLELHALGSTSHPDSNRLTVHIHRIRKKLDNKEAIETVEGGYRLSLPVVRSWEPPE